jgi:hypothetical protein
MDGQKALDIDPRTVPAVPPVPVVPSMAAPLELPVWLAVAAGLLGPVLAEVCAALEPVPAHPGAPESVLSLVLGYATLATWLGAAVWALARRPGALGWAAGAAGLTTLMVIACPTTGHHAGFGTWWYGELAVSVAALAASAVALRWWAARSLAR